jgi:SAM-dependent methyltransferase
MGILKPHIEIICSLKKKYPGLFQKKTLTISQQAVYADEKQVKNILLKNNIKIKKIDPSFDKKNKIPDWFNTKYDKNINAQYLFSLFGSDQVFSSDSSKYENSDLVIDLNNRVNNKLINKFDNIVDIGTLEHVFDTCSALENYIRMLKKGGYLLIAVPCSNMIDHGFYNFSPTLFYDYFTCNNFKVLSSYLRESSPFIYEYRSKIYSYNKLGLEIPFISDRAVEFIILAKKIKNIKKVKKPIQSVYLNKKGWKENKISLNKNIRQSLYFFIKIIIFKALLYLPFSFQKIIFIFIRGKNIKKF